MSSSAELARSLTAPRKRLRRRPIRPAQTGGATRYLAVVGLAIAAIPLLVGDAILIRRLVFVLVLSLVAISLDFTYSFTGELALGQVGVYATGAYAAGVLDDSVSLQLLGRRRTRSPRRGRSGASGRKPGAEGRVLVLRLDELVHRRRDT